MVKEEKEEALLLSGRGKVWLNKKRVLKLRDKCLPNTLGKTSHFIPSSPSLGGEEEN